MRPIDSDHSRLDARSLALHRLVAQKVLADPALLDKARANVRRWQESYGTSSLALAEWEQILSGSVGQVAEFLVGSVGEGDAPSPIEPVHRYIDRSRTPGGL